MGARIQGRNRSVNGESNHFTRPEGLCRRSFLELGASGSLLLAGLWLTSFGCRAETPSAAERLRFIDSIRARYREPAVAQPIARASGWSEAEALAILTRDTPRLPTAGELPSFLDNRIRRDFVAGRVEIEDRWSLSETEVAIAVVVAGPSR